MLSSLVHFIHQYPCKCENLRSNFLSQNSQDSSTITVNTELTRFTFTFNVNWWCVHVNSYYTWKFMKTDNRKSFSGNEGKDMKSKTFSPQIKAIWSIRDALYKYILNTELQAWCMYVCKYTVIVQSYMCSMIVLLREHI